MKKLKNMKIDENLHTELKKYAKENSLKLNDWVEKMIKREFEKLIEKNDNK
jgi:predicted HicB family RNase H-like nuclease